MLASALPAAAFARDSFFFGGPSYYTPRAYYAPYHDGRARYDDAYRDPLIRRTAEQLRRAPKPPPTKGPLLIVVSLTNQHLTLYDDGVAIAHSPVSSGTASYPTPTGLFSVIQKARYHRSNLYDDAPMPFMQRLTWSGVALHAGKLPGYPASHGCVRLPDAFAVRLWRTTAMGARVVITQKGMAPVEISHPRLFGMPSADAVPMAQDKPLVQPASAMAGAGAPAGEATAESSVGTPPTAETKVASTAPVAPDSSGSGQAAVDKPLRAGPVSVFVSRKEQRLYVRKGFEPVFDVPVVIENPEQPLGTHLFIAMNPKDGASEPRWMVISPPSKETGVVSRAPARAKSRGKAAAAPAPAAPAMSPAAASAALDRIEIPAEASARITELMSVGAALTISDEGLGPETGKETDFVVVTSPPDPPRKRQQQYDSYGRYDRPARYDYYPNYGRRWF